MKRIILSLSLTLLPSLVLAQPDLSVALDKANQCRDIESKLKRLQCFDEVFDTPMAIKTLAGLNSVQYPPSWTRAVNNEKSRGSKKGFILNQQDENDKLSSVWLTAAATNVPAQDQTQLGPILMLTCFEKISRVQLILPQPIKAGRVTISIPGSPVVTQNWISDDSGYLLRSGRGIPAIDAIKAMISAPQLILRSDVAGIDNVEFDNKNLAEAIKPMREICRW
ncbi:type VI secretion system-associated protein VasI [uncultured Photobacterium sp.]|uniref:type VI secretion system-associated protein VasI n=1 Tax=uncultured Photobacterium sp. TaxID=173973 RepID=UPI00261593C8|nr:type VI secretion system-associated protein VasI [uncultured Photobacterium sp.]